MWRGIVVSVFGFVCLILDIVHAVMGRENPADMRFVLAAVGLLGLFTGYSLLDSAQRIAALEKQLVERK
jgi:xanthosine utilization system XapX-like protein